MDIDVRFFGRPPESYPHFFIEVTMCSFIYYIYTYSNIMYIIYIYNYKVYTVDAVEEKIEDSTCKTTLFFASGSLIKPSFLLLRPLFRLA